MIFAIAVALAEIGASAQQIAASIGPKVLVPLGAPYRFGFGLEVRAVVFQGAYFPERAVGVELGVVAEARLFGDSEYEFVAGGSAGVGAGQPCLYVPTSFGLRALAGYNTRWGPILQTGAELRWFALAHTIEVARLHPRRADLRPAWALPTAGFGLAFPIDDWARCWLG